MRKRNDILEFTWGASKVQHGCGESPYPSFPVPRHSAVSDRTHPSQELGPFFSLSPHVSTGILSITFTDLKNKQAQNRNHHLNWVSNSGYPANSGLKGAVAFRGRWRSKRGRLDPPQPWHGLAETCEWGLPVPLAQHLKLGSDKSLVDLKTKENSKLLNTERGHFSTLVLMLYKSPLLNMEVLIFVNWNSKWIALYSFLQSIGRTTNLKENLVADAHRKKNKNNNNKPGGRNRETNMPNIAFLALHPSFIVQSCFSTSVDHVFWKDEHKQQCQVLVLISEHCDGNNISAPLHFLLIFPLLCCSCALLLSLPRNIMDLIIFPFPESTNATMNFKKHSVKYQHNTYL